MAEFLIELLEPMYETGACKYAVVLVYGTTGLLASVIRGNKSCQSAPFNDQP